MDTRNHFCDDGTIGTIQHVAYTLYGHGSWELDAHAAYQQLLDDLPTMPIEQVATIVRQTRQEDRYDVILQALAHSTMERGRALKALFTAEEITAMGRRK